MEIYEFFDVNVVGLGYYLVALAKQIGDEGHGAGFMVVSAGIWSLKTYVGAFGWTLRTDADLLGLPMVYAGHMFHFESPNIIIFPSSYRRTNSHNHRMLH